MALSRFFDWGFLRTYLNIKKSDCFHRKSTTAKKHPFLFFRKRQDFQPFRQLLIKKSEGSIRAPKEAWQQSNPRKSFLP